LTVTLWRIMYSRSTPCHFHFDNNKYPLFIHLHAPFTRFADRFLDKFDLKLTCRFPWVVIRREVWTLGFEFLSFTKGASTWTLSQMFTMFCITHTIQIESPECAAPEDAVFPRTWLQSGFGSVGDTTVSAIWHRRRRKREERTQKKEPSPLL